MGRITLYIAASVDGFVADDEGGVAWLDEYEAADPGAPGSYEAFFESVDCLLVGATTYEQVLDFGEWPYGDRPTYVVTSRDLPRATDAVRLADDPSDLAARLAAEYEHVWLVGGAQLARTLLAAGAVDELRLTVVPILLGSGVALFDGDGTERALERVAIRENGEFVELHYAVDP